MMPFSRQKYMPHQCVIIAVPMHRKLEPERGLASGIEPVRGKSSESANLK
jgi:hypothetical protein